VVTKKAIKNSRANFAPEIQQQSLNVGKPYTTTHLTRKSAAESYFVMSNESKNQLRANSLASMQNDAERNAGDTEEEWTDEEVEEYISLDIHDPELLANPHIFEGMVVHVRPLIHVK